MSPRPHSAIPNKIYFKLKQYTNRTKRAVVVQPLLTRCRCYVKITVTHRQQCVLPNNILVPVCAVSVLNGKKKRVRVQTERWNHLYLCTWLKAPVDKSLRFVCWGHFHAAQACEFLVPRKAGCLANAWPISKRSAVSKTQKVCFLQWTR